MTILLERIPVPERGIFELNLHQSIDIRVTAEEARRLVNRWLLDYVSYMMHAEAPTLVIEKQQVVWRVPAILTAAHVGSVGIAGTVDVDVQSGRMNNTPECKEQITKHALEMAGKLPPYQPSQTVPEEFIPKHLPRPPMLQLVEENEL